MMSPPPTDPLTRRERLALVLVTQGAAPSSVRAWARRQLARPEARAAYEALTAAERAAAAVDVTRGQAASLEDRLFASLDEQEGSRGLGLKWAAPLALAGAAAAIAAFAVLPDQGATTSMTAELGAFDGELGELHRRGLSDGTLGVAVRCLAEGEQLAIAGEVAADARGGSPTLRCGRDDLLSFAFTNTTADPLHVMVVGVSANDELRWYAPFVADGRSVPVAPGTVNEPLKVAADLSPMSAGERVVLRAVFSRRPLDGNTVRAVVEQARSRQLSPSSLDRLPLRGTVQARVDLRVDAGSARAPRGTP